MVCQAVAAARLPLLSQLLGLCRRGDRAPWRAAWRLAGPVPAVPLRSLAPRWLRPGSLSATHGYATADSALHFQLLAPDALGSLGERASPQAGIGACGAARRACAGPGKGGRTGERCKNGTRRAS